MGVIFSAVSSRAAQTNSDPLCALTNAQSTLGAGPPQPESTRKMSQRLAQIRSAINPMADRYLSDQLATIMAAILDKITNAVEKVEWRLKLANTLTEAG